ncbi:MAG: hypothetical protein ACLS89_07085 [Collinsella sp.]
MNRPNTATVDNLPEAAQGKYGFVWRLGVNAVDVDKFEADSGDKLGTQGHRPVLDRGL